MKRLITTFIFAVTTVFSVHAAEFYTGSSSIEITPQGSVALSGQMHTRISQKNETPLYAVALAMESRDGDRSIDHAITVSCDLVAIRNGIIDRLREQLKGKLDGLDVNKIFLNATHTHTAPVTVEGGNYEIPTEGVISPETYTQWLIDRLEEVITQSWNQRQLSQFGFGQGQAVIAQNRRAVYADGSAVMYGSTQDPNFRHIEGKELHDLDVMFFWNQNNELTATIVNLACPAQEVEGLNVVHADFWDPVRRQLREKYGENLNVIAWIAPAGDVVSRPMFDKKADERMRRLRGISRLDEMARRIMQGWEEAYEAASLEKISDPEFSHQVRILELPLRAVTEKELQEAKANMEKYAGNPQEAWRYGWNKRVVDKHEAMSNGTSKPFSMELHTLRIGETAVATNPFELFTAYGIQMKAFSPATQTFLIQLSGSGSYLPTPDAVRGGGYSAVIQSSQVGPEGGQKLVQETIADLKKLW